MNDKRRIEYKPLSFTTTLRNPERIAGFLTCLKQFDGQVLTNDLIYEIVKVIIKEKLYKTMYEMSVSRLKAVYDSEDVIFNDKQLEEIIKNSPQNHKESGFDRGWPSRFDTWYKICKELGFVYYKMGEQIRISQTGYMLCDAYKNIEDNMSSKIQNVFLNALVKYQSDNPFRRNANKNVPVVLLMRLLKLLKQDKSENGAGISRKEISFVLCWGNNDAIKLFYYIKEFRKKHGFRASDDTIYASCLSLLNSTNQKRFKKVQITKEGVDDFLRKIRITGIFSIRGMGRFIDFNELEHDKINYILEKYGEYRAFNNELEYYNFAGLMDANIISIKTNTATYNIKNIRQSKLAEVAEKYTNEQIIEELELLSNNRKSKDIYFSDIDEPTRLEFLTSIALQQSLKDTHIEPNYAIDDEGNPTFTARGGIGDIEVYDKNYKSLFEVTLMRGKQQAVSEIPAITRHLDELNDKNKFAVFIAPLLHADTIYMIGYTKSQHKLDIFGYTIFDFCKKLRTTTKLEHFVTL
jgi:CCATC--recognizing type II restriction modification system (mmyCVI) endonuclease subunit